MSGAFGQQPAEDDPWEHPGFKAFAARVKRELVPKLEDSAFTIGIFTGKADVKMAVEMGYSLLMGKPIIIAVTPGAHVPDGLARAADEIVEVDFSDPGAAQPRLMEALDRVSSRWPKKDEEEQS